MSERRNFGQIEENPSNEASVSQAYLFAQNRCTYVFKSQKLRQIKCTKMYFVEVFRLSQVLPNAWERLEFWIGSGLRREILWLE